jgi:hypothetical protein
MGAMAYDAHEDIFRVRFDPQQIKTEDIVPAVWMAGRQAGREYLPQVIS